MLGQELSSCHVHCVDLCVMPYYYRVGYSMGTKHIVMHIEIKKIDIVFQNMCLLLFVYTNDFIADLCLDKKKQEPTCFMTIVYLSIAVLCLTSVQTLLKHFTLATQY